MIKEQYITKIMQCIDEVHPESQNDICSCYSIDRFLEDATLEILRLAPKYRLKNRIDFANTSVEKLSDGTGRIKTPEGFVRLTNLRMEGWHRDATSTITTEDKLYYKKTNRITGGGVAKPIVVEDGGYLYYYSIPETMEHNIVKAEAIISIGALEEFDDFVADCVIWLTTHKLFIISSELPSAESALEQFKYKLSIL